VVPSEEEGYQDASRIARDGSLALIAACKEAWLALPQELLNKLVMSMKKRFETVRKAKGWYTKY
jgi:hypothetical protein